MSPKSRKKFKNSVQKKQVGQTRPAAVAQPGGAAPQQATIISATPAAPKIVQETLRVAPARPARAPLPTTRASSIRTEFVGIEMRNIGILAVLMLVILFVLARVI